MNNWVELLREDNGGAKFAAKLQIYNLDDYWQSKFKNLDRKGPPIGELIFNSVKHKDKSNRLYEQIEKDEVMHEFNHLFDYANTVKHTYAN